MARARNIKPSIMDNEDLADLPPITRLLFIYLWMLADREGRLEDRPKRIGQQALGYDRDADVNAMLDALKDAGFIVRYAVEGKSFIQIVQFKRHQSPHLRESASDIPAQGTTKALPRQDLGDGKAPPGSPDSGFLNPDSGLLIADTVPAQVCEELQKAGMQDAHPGDPKLIELIDAGLTPEEILSAGLDAVAKKKPFSYALATAEGRRRDAAIAPLPDKRSRTTPGPAGPDPALAKIKADAAKAAPPSLEVLARMAAIRQGAHA